MLLLDGHSSHYMLELVKLAAAHDVVIFCLPPHTTANSQPLDTSASSHLKPVGQMFVANIYLPIQAE